MILPPTRHTLLLLGLLMSLLPACGEETAGCPSGQVECDGGCMDAIEPTAAAISEKVFNLHCTSCHQENYYLDNEGLKLESLDDISALIDKASVQMPKVMLIKAGDAASSYLIHKMRGQYIKTDKGIMPPPAYPQLCKSKIKAVEDWINQL